MKLPALHMWGVCTLRQIPQGLTYRGLAVEGVVLQIYGCVSAALCIEKELAAVIAVPARTPARNNLVSAIAKRPSQVLWLISGLSQLQTGQMAAITPATWPSAQQ